MNTSRRLVIDPVRFRIDSIESNFEQNVVWSDDDDIPLTRSSASEPDPTRDNQYSFATVPEQMSSNQYNNLLSQYRYQIEELRILIDYNKDEIDHQMDKLYRFKKNVTIILSVLVGGCLLQSLFLRKF